MSCVVRSLRFLGWRGLGVSCYCCLLFVDCSCRVLLVVCCCVFVVVARCCYLLRAMSVVVCCWWFRGCVSLFVVGCL